MLLLKRHSNVALVRGTSLKKMSICIETVQRAPQQKHKASQQLQWVLWVNLRPACVEQLDDSERLHTLIEARMRVT